MKNNIAIGNETIKVTKEGRYTIGENSIELVCGDYTEVEVYSPKRIQAIMDDEDHSFSNVAKTSAKCAIKVVNDDSFQAGKGYERPLVMNFANAECPGGGFLLGATAQEESLCRTSTLYASIASDKAKEMYQYNRKHFNPVNSDYMLLSKDVCVFRDRDCNFLEEPYMVSVITLPAPNKRGAAMFTSQKKLDEVMTMRIRMMLRIAAMNQYKTLVLGAWGCGAFGHNPDAVAGYFKNVLCGEKYISYFETIIFAVLGKENGRNITAFRNAFESNL